MNCKNQPALSDLFDPQVYTYTRRQAIEDGVLVDLMQPDIEPLVREAGFKYPVAMTIGAFSRTVQVPDQPLPPGQDLRGRLWDVLWMLKVAISRTSGGDRVAFEVHVRNGRKLELVRLWSQCGPGDQGEPVITIMLQGED
jgi:hypothetical protein